MEDGSKLSIHKHIYEMINDERQNNKLIQCKNLHNLAFCRKPQNGHSWSIQQRKPKFSNSICPSSTLHIRLFICFGVVFSICNICIDQNENRFCVKGSFQNKIFYWHEIIDLKLKTDHMASIRLKNCFELIFHNIRHASFRQTYAYQQKPLNLRNSIFKQPKSISKPFLSISNHFSKFRG